MLIGNTPLTIIVAALVTMVIAALLLSGVLRVLLIAQAVYWAMSYVARPVVLLVVQPAASFGDNVADPRLVALGYDRGIEQALTPVAFGLVVYALLMLGYALWSRRRGPRPRRPVPLAGDPNMMGTLLVLYALGTLARLASVASGSAGAAGEVASASPVLSLLAMPATLGAVGLIVLARPARNRDTMLLLGFLVLGELWWTTAIQSKTPVLGAALAVAVRFALTGWTREKVLGIGAVSVAGIAGFDWLQSLKSTPYLRAQAASVDAAYPEPVRPFLSLLRRFDLLEAATDAYFTKPGSWLTPDQVVTALARSLVPGQLLPGEKLQAGTAWATDVRGASVDMSQVSVSLAEGSIPEGYVLGGYAGVVIGVVFTAIVLIAWSRALYARHMVPVLFGIGLIEVPVVFERGMLGTAETLGKYLQVVVLAWMVRLAVGEWRRHRERTTAPVAAAVPVPVGSEGKQ
ncbi:hypothetical protein [Nocardia asteroides]|uniref:hypothetical protein n=1 Tax=Nocardia asteroides TaxID=1824 RepID=UPI001E48546B|nr:hypothetical protein [Nocardia asteroides]UGT62769.1 hypothetical protein LTT61_05365 [Nocardia asteroides]